MDFFGIAKDTVDGFLRANVPMLNLIPDGKKLVQDPLGALGDQGKALLNFFVPAVPLGDAARSGFSDKPNVQGAAGAPILTAALSSIKQMLEQCGAYMTPDEGSGFQTGHDAFEGIADGLSVLDAPDSWQGAAAEAYTFANDLQRGRMRQMAELDGRIHEAIAAEAADNVDTRTVLGDAAQFLNGCIAPALVLGAYELQAGLAFEAEAVSVALPKAISRFQQLVHQAAAHAEEVDYAGRSYHAIRGEYDGRAPQTSGAELQVAPPDLRTLSQHQQQAAGTIGSTEQIGAFALLRLRFTHGNVCQATTTATASAVEARAATIDWLRGESEQIADGLNSAAKYYERIDAQQAHHIGREMPPR